MSCNRTRNILVMIGIGIGIASFVLLSSISFKMLEKVEGSDPIKEQIRISTRGGIDYNGVKYLEHLSKVKAVSPVVLKGTSIEVKGELRSVVLRLVDPKKEIKLRSWELTSGRWLLPEDTSAVVIGSKLANIIEKDVGDVLDIGDRKYRIVGIVEENSLSLSSNIDSAIMMPLAGDSATKFSEVMEELNLEESENILECCKDMERHWIRPRYPFPEKGDIWNPLKEFREKDAEEAIEKAEFVFERLKALLYERYGLVVE